VEKDAFAKFLTLAWRPVCGVRHAASGMRLAAHPTQAVSGNHPVHDIPGIVRTGAVSG